MPDLEHDSAPLGEANGWLIYKAGRGWYRPQAQGYTNDPRQAGRYTREEADAYSHPNGWDGPRDEISIHHESEVLRQSPEPSSSEMRVKGLDQFEEAVRLAEVGEYLYDACAYSYGDGHTEPREFGIEWHWQQSSPNEYGQGQLLAAATKWHEEQAADGIVTEAAKLRTMLTAAPTLSPTVSQPVSLIDSLSDEEFNRDASEDNPNAGERPVTGEGVEWTEPPLTCPHIDAAIASGELSAEVAQELATIRGINSQLRYGTWALKARLSDYQALKAERDEALRLAQEYQRQRNGNFARAEAAEASLSAVEGAGVERIMSWLCDDVLPAYGIDGSIARNDPEVAESAREALNSIKGASHEQG